MAEEIDVSDAERALKPFLRPSVTPSASGGVTDSAGGAWGSNFAGDPHNEGMSAVTREEIDAKLDAVRSDVRAGNAELSAAFHAMRADMADMRAGVLTEVAGIRGELAVQSGAVAGQMGEIRGALDGVKTSLTTVQWLVGALLAAAALYVSVAQFLAPQPTPAAQQPIIINVPAAAAASPAQPANKP